MGTWGPGIFDDDVASDVRDIYRELLGDGVSDDEAAERLIAEFRVRGSLTPVFWLAFAATQASLGRLTRDVRDRAVEVISDGTDLRAWAEVDVAHRRRREAALRRLRTKLEGPQPTRRTVRPEWKPSTDLEPGEVLGWTVPDGSVRLLRIIRIEQERGGSWPLLELLGHRGGDVPPPLIAALAPAYRRCPTGGTGPARRWVVSQNHRADPGWHRAGFRRVALIDPRPGDEVAPTNEIWSDWEALGSQLDTLEWH
jgi:hypothetical protein